MASKDPKIISTGEGEGTPPLRSLSRGGGQRQSSTPSHPGGEQLLSPMSVSAPSLLVYAWQQFVIKASLVHISLFVTSCARTSVMLTAYKPIRCIALCVRTHVYAFTPRVHRL